MGAELTPSWMHGAACLNHANPSIFFEEVRQSIVKEAKLVCKSCAVCGTCLEYAMKHEEVGVWGGTTTNQRAKVRRRQNLDKMMSIA